MPQARSYKKGSIIYFDGEMKTNFAYLLQAGALVRVKLAPESVQPERIPLRVGEFFGIKAALGVLPRDETIEVAADSTVFVFTPAEFDAVIKKNVSIIFKMLRAFSNELRRIHHAIEMYMHADGSPTVDGAAGLHSIAQYYMVQKNGAQCRYVCERYLEHYPNGSQAAEIQDMLAQLDASGEAEAPAPAPASKPAAPAAPAKLPTPAAAAQAPAALAQGAPAAAAAKTATPAAPAKPMGAAAQAAARMAAAKAAKAG